MLSRELLLASFLLILVTVSAYDGGFREVALDIHNHHRTLLGLRPLILNPELNVAAQTYAVKLATELSFGPSEFSDTENLWAHYGPLRPLSLSTRDASNAWFTGSQYPGHVLIRTNERVIRSNQTSEIGIGVETNDKDQGYTVVVAYYL